VRQRFWQHIVFFGRLQHRHPRHSKIPKGEFVRTAPHQKSQRATASKKKMHKTLPPQAKLHNRSYGPLAQKATGKP